jgi:hypothetical protein
MRLPLTRPRFVTFEAAKIQTLYLSAGGLGSAGTWDGVEKCKKHIFLFQQGVVGAKRWGFRRHCCKPRLEAVPQQHCIYNIAISVLSLLATAHIGL